MRWGLTQACTNSCTALAKCRQFLKMVLYSDYCHFSPISNRSLKLLGFAAGSISVAASPLCWCTDYPLLLCWRARRLHSRWGTWSSFRVHTLLAHRERERESEGPQYPTHPNFLSRTSNALIYDRSVPVQYQYIHYAMWDTTINIG